MDELGKKLIEAINKSFEIKIPLTEETTKAMASVVSEFTDEIIDGTDYGYCPDCDQRMPDEPMRDESRD